MHDVAPLDLISDHLDDLLETLPPSVSNGAKTLDEPGPVDSQHEVTGLITSRDQPPEPVFFSEVEQDVCRSTHPFVQQSALVEAQSTQRFLGTKRFPGIFPCFPELSFIEFTALPVDDPHGY